MMFSSWRLSDAISSAIFASGGPYSVPLFALLVRRASSRPVVEPARWSCM